MKLLTKIAWASMILAAAALSGCGGGGGSTAATDTTDTATGTVALSGVAVKGPFVKDSTVAAYKLNNDGTRSTTDTATTTTTNDLGSYDLSVTWGGLTEVTITGKYLDETTGNVTAVDGTVSAVVNLPAPAATPTPVKANPNVASTMAAKVVQKTLLANPISATADAAAVTKAVTETIQASDKTVAVALGIPTEDEKGNAIDLSQLNLLDTANTDLGAANKALLAVSATLQDAVNNGAATSMDAFVTSLVKDVESGAALGSDSGATATIVTSQTFVDTYAADIAATITTAITTVAATDTTVTLVEDTALAADLLIATQEVAAVSSVVLRGFAMMNNTFTMGANGANSFSIDSYGVATTTAAAGNATANAVIFGFKFADYSNAAGNGNGAAATYNATFTFAVDDVNSSRKVRGSLPVSITTDGYGSVSATVLASAVLTFEGVDSQGVNVSGTATNVGANIIQNNAANATAITVDVSALMTTIQAKVGASATQFAVLNTAGTFDFVFGINGINVGFDNAGNNGLTSLLPLDSTGNITGRAFKGQIVTQ